MVIHIRMQLTKQQIHCTIVVVLHQGIIICLHFNWENVLLQVGHTLGCPIPDGKREHLTSLANMVQTLQTSWRGIRGVGQKKTNNFSFSMMSKHSQARTQT